MATRLSKRHFWQWFTRHNTEYMELGKKSKKELKYWMNELTAHLRAYYKFLNVSIYADKDGLSYVLTITTLGKAKYFSYVDKIVALAPAIPRWTIQALEAPRPVDFFWQLEHAGIDPHEFRCAVPHEERRPIIEVYHPLYTEAKDWLFQEAAEAAVYNVLEERSFGLDISWVTIDNLSWVEEGEELIRLEDLPGYLSSEGPGLSVDAQGRIIG